MNAIDRNKINCHILNFQGCKIINNLNFIIYFSLGFLICALYFMYKKLN